MRLEGPYDEIRDEVRQQQLEISRLTRVVNNLPNTVARHVGRAMDEMHGSLSQVHHQELNELKERLRSENEARVVADQEEQRRMESRVEGLIHDLQREKDKVLDLTSQVQFLMRTREQANERLRSPVPRGTRDRRYRRKSHVRSESESDSDRSISPRVGRCGCCIHGLHRHTRRHHHRGVRSNHGGHSESDDSHLSESGNRHHVDWRGPKQSGLKELRPTDQAFRPAVSYRRYRLRNIDQRADATTNAQIGQYSRLMRHNLETFDGSEPIGVLEFLANFQKQCDENGVSEGLAVRLLPKFLGGDAKETFRSYVDTVVYGLGGAKTYPEAVNHLLHTFAKDSVIEQAVESLNTMKQGAQESEGDFGRRLRRQARKCGNVFSEKQLITRFVRGTHENVKPLLRATYDGASISGQSFSDYVEKAQALGTAHRALSQSGTRKLKNDRPGRPDKISMIATASDPGPKEAVLALANEYPPSQFETATEDTDYRRVMQTAPSDSTDPTQQEVQDSQLVNQIEKKRYFYPNRVGWKDGNRTRQHDLSYRGAGNQDRSREHQPKRNQPDDICFECYGVGHRKPNCPFLEKSAYDSTYQNLRRTNYAKLHPLQKEWLGKVGQTPPFATTRDYQGVGPPPKVADLPPVELTATVPADEPDNSSKNQPGATQ